MLGFNPLASEPLAAVFINVYVPVTGQELLAIQNSVELLPDNTVLLTGFSTTLTLNGVTLDTTANVELTSLVLQSTVHSMRMWRKINTTQTTGWTEIKT